MVGRGPGGGRLEAEDHGSRDSTPAVTEAAICSGWALAFPATHAASAPGMAMAVRAALRRSSGSLSTSPTHALNAGHGQPACCLK